MNSTEALDAALAVRRGQKRLADFSKEEQPLVRATLHVTPEIKLADLARSQECGNAKPFSFARNLR